MFKTNIILLLLFTSCISPSNVSLPLNKVSVSGVTLGRKSGQLVKKFGKPDSIVQVNPEMDIDPYRKYHYGKSFFAVTGNSIDGFEINDNRFILDQGKIRIGENISKVKETFGTTLFFNGNQAKVRIGSSDDYLLFVFWKDKVYSFSIYKEM